MAPPVANLDYLATLAVFRPRNSALLQVGWLNFPLRLNRSDRPGSQSRVESSRVESSGGAGVAAAIGVFNP